MAISDVANKYFQDSVPWELVKTDSGAAQEVCTLRAQFLPHHHRLDQADPAALCGRRRSGSSASRSFVFDDAARFDLTSITGSVPSSAWSSESSRRR